MTSMRAAPQSAAGAPAVEAAPLIEATDLVKCYGDLCAVNGVDFTVQPRDFLGFLGPNGAGKSTLMKMIYCLVEPTSGRLRVFDTDVRADPSRIKARLGVVPQENNLDPDLTVWDNLLVYARYFGLRGPEVERRAKELLDFMELWEKRDTVIGKLSGGMKRRLVIARALLNEPDVVILDEPTTGLDPQVRHLIWDRLLELREQGLTFLLTTHYMEEAENLCDRLLIMDNGCIIARGRPLDLVREHVGEFVLELIADTRLEAEIAQAHPDLGRQRSGQRLYLYGGGAEELAPLAQRYGGRESRLRPTSVEDVFLKLTGREIRE